MHLSAGRPGTSIPRTKLANCEFGFVTIIGWVLFVGPHDVFKNIVLVWNI